MSIPFQGSRLANLRQKRQSGVESMPPAEQIQKPLTLSAQQDTSYQPSSMGFQGGRTGTRFLKGRIQRPSNAQKPILSHLIGESDYVNKQSNVQQQKTGLRLNDQSSGEFKLVLNDSPQFDNKKSQIKMAPLQPAQKRVLIQKKQSKQQPKPQPKPQIRQQVKPAKVPVNNIQQQAINPKNQGAIKQEEVQQSKDGLQNQNELVECPQGCGRKFNRKALQKHAKACKVVFMSKRKEFNSEAKRFTSNQQAALVKQNKLQQKKAQLGMTKGSVKGFDKTTDNWKVASQDFRSALKAVKKQGTQEQGQHLKAGICQYCEKPFAQALLPKHMQNCIRRKQKQVKDKKKATKKK